MKRIPDELLKEMARELSSEDRDEMAIPSYLHSNPAFRWMAWRRIEVLASHFQDLCQRQYKDFEPTVMDYGCGTGILFDELGQYARRIYGVDLVLTAANLLVKRWGLDKVTLLTPDQIEESIPPHSVDIIIAGEVLEHVDVLMETLTNFKRYLKPGGILLVSVPTESRLYRLGRYLAGFHGHYHHRHAQSIHRGIISAGFIQRLRVHIPLPGPFAIYWVVDYSYLE